MRALTKTPVFDVQKRRLDIYYFGQKAKTAYVWAGPEMDLDVFQVNGGL